MKIRTKLIISFIIPILCIITLGVVSYQKAADGICSSYEFSTAQSIKMSGEYLNIGVIQLKRLRCNVSMIIFLNCMRTDIIKTTS